VGASPRPASDSASSDHPGACVFGPAEETGIAGRRSRLGIRVGHQYLHRVRFCTPSEVRPHVGRRGPTRRIGRGVESQIVCLGPRHMSHTPTSTAHRGVGLMSAGVPSARARRHPSTDDKRKYLLRQTERARSVGAPGFVSVVSADGPAPYGARREGLDNAALSTQQLRLPPVFRNGTHQTGFLPPLTRSRSEPSSSLRRMGQRAPHKNRPPPSLNEPRQTPKGGLFFFPRAYALSRVRSG